MMKRTDKIIKFFMPIVLVLMGVMILVAVLPNVLDVDFERLKSGIAENWVYVLAMTFVACVMYLIVFLGIKKKEAYKHKKLAYVISGIFIFFIFAVIIYFHCMSS